MNWKQAVFALCSLVICGLSVAAITLAPSVAIAGDDADSGSAADGGGDGGGPGRK